jgi:hypothetical protein
MTLFFIFRIIFWDNEIFPGKLRYFGGIEKNTVSSIENGEFPLVLGIEICSGCKLSIFVSFLPFPPCPRKVKDKYHKRNMMSRKAQIWRDIKRWNKMGKKWGQAPFLS